MKGVKQATLFQSWGNQKKEIVTSNDNVETAPFAATGRDNFEKVPRTAGTSATGHGGGGVIDLCDSFEDGDDELLFQAEETLNLEWNAQGQAQNGRDTGNKNTSFGDNFEADHGEHGEEKENECNISIGAEHFTLTQRQSMCKNLPGFDMCAGKLWIYPTNYPVRDYQYNIVHQSLFKNTMVTLPTGLGKTFIAAVVMYNFYRWYPQGKVVFMAPTKPLVAQQIEACYSIMGIPQDHTAEMTGSMGPPKREKAWQEKRVFFLTPQVLTNDLSRGSCPAEDVKCLVIDEAHKALGNHAYCQVVRELVKYTENFRVLALSATPGSDIKAVQQVLTNLLISHIEIRTEESIDIKQYSHERKVDKIVVPLGEELTKVKEKYLHIMDVVVSRLKRQGVLYNRDTSSLSKFLILKSRDAFRQNPPERLPRNQYGVVEADYALAMSLYHGFELLQLHGSRSLYNFLEGILSGEKGHGRTKAELTRNGDFNEIMSMLAERYAKPVGEAVKPGDPQKFVTGHPKMEKLQEIVLEHFNRFKDQGMSATRVMIFSQYRDSVQEITDMLNVHRPLVKVMSFIGQSSAGKATKGFTQKEQLQVMKQFREGGYNTLVSTCVGEEGLDIGDVDLIICFDAHKSPIRLVQRMGRTGRKREGRIVMLVTQGKEEQIYNQSQYSKKTIHKAILNGARSLHFYQHSPRMVPEQLDPKSHKMYITVKESFKPSKRVAAEPRGDQNKITSLFDNAKKGEKEEVISAEEYQELKDWFVDRASVPTLPRSRLMCLDKEDGVEVNPETLGPKLSLSEWLPWQNTLQDCEKIDHSVGTKHLVQIMEFIQLQQSLDPSDDPYGLEMAAYLNEDDVLKPGETEGASDNILKYCVNKKPDKSSDIKGVTKSKKSTRRSDALKDIDDDHKDDDSSGDDLPAFALSPDNHMDIEIENQQENNKNADENHMKQVNATERSGYHEVHGKMNSKNANSNKKSIGSRAKSLERRMSEDILRKSKKRKRSKVSLNQTKIVDLIADNDSSDFDDDDGNTHIMNDTRDTNKINVQKEETGLKDTNKSKQAGHSSGMNNLLNVSNNRLHIDNVNIEEYKVSTPPSIEDAIAHCASLDDSSFLDRMDITDILDEDEKENFKKRMDKYDSHKKSTHERIMSSSLDNDESFWTTKLLKNSYCEEVGFQSFLEVKRENDILLKKLFSDKKNKHNHFNEKLLNGENNKNNDFSKNKFDLNTSIDINFPSVSPTKASDKLCSKLKSSSFVRPSSNSLHFEDKLPSLSKPAKIKKDLSEMPSNNSIHIDQIQLPCSSKPAKGLTPNDSSEKPANKSLNSENKVLSSSSKPLKNQTPNDSWFVSADDEELALACSTQNLPQNTKDLKPTQVTFTQALACVHSSHGSEIDTASGNHKVVSSSQRKLAVSQESEDSLRNLSIPEFCTENIHSTGQFITKDENVENDTNKESSFDSPQKNVNQSDKTLTDDHKGPVLKDIEQTMSELEENFSDEEADLPQFDLGFDFDEDIIPPSPNATQQSQKGVSKCISQTFSHRLSQSVHVAHVNGDNNDGGSKTVKDTVKEEAKYNPNKVGNVSESKQCLDFSLESKKPVIDVKPEQKMSDNKHTKTSCPTKLEDIPEFSDNDSDFESEIMVNDIPNIKNQNKIDQKEKEHEEILKIAEFVSSQEPVDDPSFCLMGGDDIGDWFDSEPEWTENTELDKCENETKEIGNDKDVTEMNENKEKAIRKGLLSRNQTIKANGKATFGERKTVNNNKEVTSPKDDFQDYSEVFNKTLSKLKFKTPVSKFKGRKSTFTVDDLSPDPFNDSFDFDCINSSRTLNAMTSLKTKVKPYSVTSSTPKLGTKVIPSQLTTNFNEKSKIESPQVLEQKENLQSESESDDSFIVRKKKKPCIIESPCSQVDKEKESNKQIEETPFKTPLRDRISKKGQSMKSKLAKKKMSVSFSDDDDFDNVDPTKNKYHLPKSMTVINEGSSDDDFDEPINRKIKNDKSDSSDKSVEQTSPPKKVRKKRGSNPFIEEEAELSEDEHHGSSDESEHDLDHYDASFIQDTEQFSQSQGINATQMHAVYMESVRSPTGPGRFKLQYDYKHTDVFSQVPQEESQYMEDSFCVGEEEDDWLFGAYEEKIEPMEVTMMHPDVTLMKTGRTRRQRGAKKVIESGIERAKHQGRLKALDKLKSKIAAKNKNKVVDESDKTDIETSDRVLPIKKSRIQINDDISSEDESKSKAYPLSDLESPEIKTKKRRLKTKMFSSSDEEDIGAENKAKKNNSSAEFIYDDFEKKENKNLTKLKERSNSTTSISSKPNQGTSDSVDLKSDFDPDLLIFNRDKSKNMSKGVILVDSKEISGSQDIVSDLRFKHNVHVSAAQLPGCDYIISNRMAVERKQWSEFSNGANREKLTERIQALKELYDRPILIVEKDRVKPGEEKHPRPLHWSKYVDKTVALLLKSSVKVLYTDNQKETATLLSDLCQLEIRKGLGITAKVDLNTDKQNKVKFFASLPKLSYIHALNLAHGFKSVSDFMKSSVQEIQTKGQMSENRAVDVYKFLRRQFDADMLSK